jgi:hypothetical protein
LAWGLLDQGIIARMMRFPFSSQHFIAKRKWLSLELDEESRAMTHARLFGLLADKGFEVFIYWLVPPGEVGVPPGSVVVYLDQPRPHLRGTST